MAGSGLVCVIAVALLGLTTAVPLPKDGGNIPLEDVVFQLYTISNAEMGARVVIGDPESLKAANFDPSLPTKIIIHGWMDALENEVIQSPKKAFLEREPMNVFGVGWKACSRNVLYDEAVECSKQVGGYAGDLAVWLNDITGIPFDLIHALGHSLGAQAVSFIGAKARISQITALDPAGPLFLHSGPDNGLDTTDSDFVNVIHTSLGLLGMVENIGHADFYPNGGTSQPGCTDALGTCSHSAAYRYYSHTINRNYGDAYMAYQCESVEMARNQSCTGTPQAPMGYAATPQHQGIYYVNITEVPTTGDR